MIRDSRAHETAVIHTPKGSSASVGGIERANNEVEKQIRTLRSRFEENYWVSVGLDHKVLSFLVLHCSWQIAHYQVKSDGKIPRTEVVHFRNPRKSADMPKLDARWNLGLRLEKSIRSNAGTGRRAFAGMPSTIPGCCGQ